MLLRSIALLSLISVILTPVDAFAQTAPAACATPAELPAGMASWTRPKPLKAARNTKDSTRAMLTQGQAVTLSLIASPRVTYPIQPAKPGSDASFGGLASFTVDRPGIWRVALGSGAWVDVVKDGAAETSVAHGHGPACTGIRKMVDFRLEPGRYILQVAANGDPQVRLSVTRLP